MVDYHAKTVLLEAPTYSPRGRVQKTETFHWPMENNMRRNDDLEDDLSKSGNDFKNRDISHRSNQAMGGDIMYRIYGTANRLGTIEGAYDYAYRRGASREGMTPRSRERRQQAEDRHHKDKELLANRSGGFHSWDQSHAPDYRVKGSLLGISDDSPMYQKNEDRYRRSYIGGDLICDTLKEEQKLQETKFAKKQVVRCNKIVERDEERWNQYIKDADHPRPVRKMVHKAGTGDINKGGSGVGHNETSSRVHYNVITNDYTNISSKDLIREDQEDLQKIRDQRCLMLDIGKRNRLEPDVILGPKENTIMERGAYGEPTGRLVVTRLQDEYNVNARTPRSIILSDDDMKTRSILEAESAAEVRNIYHENAEKKKRQHYLNTGPSYNQEPLPTTVAAGQRPDSTRTFMEPEEFFPREHDHRRYKRCNDFNQWLVIEGKENRPIRNTFAENNYERMRR